MAANRLYQVQNAATLTTSGSSGALPNIGQTNNPTLVVYIDVTGSVSGTSPSLQVTVYGEYDSSGRKAQLAQDAAITATLTGPHRLVIHDVLEPNIFIDWVITGTTPSFGGVSINAYLTSPDY